MIEFYEIVCAMVCFIVGYLIGDYYTTEKRKGELFEANHNKIEYKCEMERYKNKYESTETTLKDLRQALLNFTLAMETANKYLRRALNDEYIRLKEKGEYCDEFKMIDGDVE